MNEKPHNPTPLNPPTAEMRDYWQALGEFIHTFTHVEKLVANALWKMSGVSIPIARAVFSSVRIDTAKDFINRILQVAKLADDDPVRTDFAYIFAQLGEITRARNDIVHHGTQFSEGSEFMVSNRHVAHIDSKVYERAVSADTLRAMTADLQKISDHLLIHWTRGWVDDDLVQKLFGKRVRDPWQYKPARPSPPEKPPQHRPPKRRRLRRS